MGNLLFADPLAVSLATYGASAGNSDYYPGPVNEDGTTDPATCSNYNRAWSVFRYEIEAHLADFADNGIIDNPQSTILAWPGTGNPQFAAENGFELPPASQGMAPFFDANADGIYQPLSGEYPTVPQSETLPDQIVWSVFNTVGGPANESGSPSAVRVEVQLLAWAFNCTDNTVLSNTIFTSYKLISRSVEAYSNLRLGLWADFDLGCYIDDYVGSVPEQNTFFVYNRFSTDVTCELDLPSAGENPPVQAITVLSQPLTGFMYYANGSIITDPPSPPIPSDLNTAEQVYNFLNNRFSDGTPLTQGGTGYDPMSTEFVDFAFPDDPNDPLGWSEYSVDIAPQDRRALGNVAGPAIFAPGETYTLDVAYSYHRSPGADHLGNVTAMYAGVAALQEDYDHAFASTCSQLANCEEDCIWSGDLNADGIANHEDVLALGFGLAAAGPARPAPYNWTPQNGDSWAMTQFNGVNAKHLDTNGDGIATPAEQDKIVQHYNLTRPGYVPVVEYPEGDDLDFRRLVSSNTLENLSPGESFSARAILATDLADLRALAFTLEYDPVYFQRFLPFAVSEDETILRLANDDVPGLVDYALYLTDPESYISPQTLLLMSLQVIDIPAELLPSNETFVRFRNIRAYLSDGTEVDLGAQSVRVQINDIAVRTAEPVWAEGIRLFPNPVTDRLHWTFGNVQPTTYRLLDMQGRTLQNGTVTESGLDLHTLPTGVYSLQMIHAETMVVRKVVKQ